MNTYTVTHNSYGDVITKWFTDKSDVKRYAKSVIRLGYAPTIHRYEEDNYRRAHSAIFPSVAVYAFFRAVDY